LRTDVDAGALAAKTRRQRGASLSPRTQIPAATQEEDQKEV